MKRNALLLLLLTTLTFLSWNENDATDGEYADYRVARPVVMSKAEFANSVDILPPISVDESGKVYAYGDYVFINDNEVHHLKNTGNEPFDFICIVPRRGEA